MGRPKSEGETWQKVADALGITTRRLLPWRTHPEAPSEPSVEEWRAFQERVGIGKGGSQELQRIKVEIASEQLVKLRRENAIGEGKVIAEEDIRDFLLNWAAKLDLLLTSELETNAPPLVVGQPIAQVRATMRETHDRIREATARGLLSWKPNDAQP